MNEEILDQGEAKLTSVAAYESLARKKLTPELINYIYGSTETGATLARNLQAFSKYLLRRRVLQGIDDVKTNVSYFDGKITSELPFFPGPINVGPLYPGALLDIIKVSKVYRIPILLSDIPIVEPLEVSKLPSLASPDAPVIWQIYLLTNNYDIILKRVKSAKGWGYKGIIVTVDTELNVKLGDEIPPETGFQTFANLTVSDIKRLRRATSMPLLVKGIMNVKDAIEVIEAGADGIVVSNHGGRIMDCGEATVEVLPEIVKLLRSRKTTRKAEIFFDGGIRRGTDILKALALGAGACLLGRPIFWGLIVHKEKGVEEIMSILKGELIRTATLCGVRDLSKVSSDVVRLV